MIHSSELATALLGLDLPLPSRSVPEDGCESTTSAWNDAFFLMSEKRVCGSSGEVLNAQMWCVGEMERREVKQSKTRGKAAS